MQVRYILQYARSHFTEQRIQIESNPVSFPYQNTQFHSTTETPSQVYQIKDIFFGVNLKGYSELYLAI